MIRLVAVGRNTCLRRRLSRAIAVTTQLPNDESVENCLKTLSFVTNSTALPLTRSYSCTRPNNSEDGTDGAGGAGGDVKLQTEKPSENDLKLFTVEEANAALPLVRLIAGDIVELTRSMIERRERLQFLKQGREEIRSDIYQDELDDVERLLEADATRLRELVEELCDLGVELKSLPEGLVDFPSIRDGRLVYLCWKYDEPEVHYWHELNAGFGGRQELSPPTNEDLSEAEHELN